MTGCSQDKKPANSTLTNAEGLDISTGISYKSGNPEGFVVSTFLKDDDGNAILFSDEILEIEITIKSIAGEIVYVGTKQVRSSSELMDTIILFNEIDESNPLSTKHLSSAKIILPDGRVIIGNEEESSQPII